ncbi:MAG: hypothetical protein ABJP02_08855 [Parasphingorhabdus sp.]|uniref:hypothetical protein n=1 Tax=Parasphingorhabdus sp. TaxID=2709688 RepID=UPI003299D7D9
MIRIWLTIGIFALVASVPVSFEPLQQQLVAQPAANNGGPAFRRVKRNFEKRVNAATKSCNLGDYKLLTAELKVERKLQFESYSRALEKIQDLQIAKVKDEDRIKQARQRFDDFGNANNLVGQYQGDLINACDPATLEYRIVTLKKQCKKKEADELLAKFKAIVTMYEKQLASAKLSGSFTTVTVKQAEKELKTAKGAYNRAAFQRVSKCKEKVGTGDLDRGGETVSLPPFSQPAPDTPEPVSTTDFEADRLGQISENSAWLLGDWVYTAWNGGTTNSVLRFRLESDGTISGYLVSITKEMAQKGYQPSMKLLRGIRDTSHQLNPNATWSHSGIVAGRFSPKDPRRRPGQIFGQDEWFNSNSVIFLEKKSGKLGGTTGFGNRLNWHRGKLVRPNLAALDETIRQLNGQIYRLSRPGNEFERLEELPGIIERLRAKGQYSQEARDTANLMQLLLERDELTNNPEFLQTLGAIESGQASREEITALASYLVAQGAHLAQPVANNDYDSKIAAHMLLIATNGSRLRDDIGNPSGAYAKTNMSRLTKGLTTLKGIAGLAGNPKDKTGQQLMNGLRDLSTIPATTAGVSPALDIPAQTSAAILQQSASGFTHASNALKEVTNAIKGDPNAINRALGHAKALERTISSRGYYEAVKGAVTERIVRRIPFVRSVVDWFK